MSKGAQNDFSNPTADLLAAIEKLETFAGHKTPPEISIHHLKRKEGNSPSLLNIPLKKTIFSVRDFFTSFFSEKSTLESHKEKQQISEVLRAIDIVKSNFYLIQKYQEGTPEQQKIATSTLAAVAAYNQTILNERKNDKGLRNRIERFLKGDEATGIGKLLKTIEFPHPIIETSEFPKKSDQTKRISHKFECPTTQAASLKIFPFIHQNPPIDDEQDTSPNDNEKAGFMMKGIANVTNLGNAFSLDDLMKTLRKTPIQAVMKSSDNRASSDHATVSLWQTIIPFPGDIINLTGEFTRKSQCSVPVSQSFSVFSKSVQTGFPHPSQHMGWALADALIPAFPQKIEHLLFLQPLLHKKNAIAKALLPKGELREKAKSLLKLKKQSFEENKMELIPQLLNLHKAIINASHNVNANELQPMVQQFFELLMHRPNAYEELSEAQHALLETYFVRPFEKLKSDWIDRSVPELFSNDLYIRYQAAFSILENDMEKRKQELLAQWKTLSDHSFEKIAIEFILGMGEVLFHPCALIILQHFSETVHFPPPTLGEFEYKIQLSLYFQLQDFLMEIENHNPENENTSIKQKLTEKIQSELHIFSSSTTEDNPRAPLINELEVYFNVQYLTKQQS